MIIIFDCDLDANGQPFTQHVIDTADPNAIQTIQMIQADKTKMDVAGYSVISKLPGLPHQNMRRWDVVVMHAQAADAPPELKALNLTA